MVIDKSNYCSIFGRRKVISLVLDKLWNGKNFPVIINGNGLILKDGLNNSELHFKSDEVGENSLLIKYLKKEKKIEIITNKLEDSMRQHYALFYGFVLVVCGFINISYEVDNVVPVYDFNQGSKDWNNLSVCQLVDKMVVPSYLLKAAFRRSLNMGNMAKIYNVSATVLYRRLKSEKIL